MLILPIFYFIALAILKFKVYPDYENITRKVAMSRTGLILLDEPTRTKDTAKVGPALTGGVISESSTTSEGSANDNDG